MNRKRPIALLTIILAFFLSIVLPGFRAANQWAQDSAHLALWAEINERLAERELTGEFPRQLLELSLTFPDNGSVKLLELIHYRLREGGCSVSTTVRGKRLECEYGTGNPSGQLLPAAINTRPP